MKEYNINYDGMSFKVFENDYCEKCSEFNCLEGSMEEIITAMKQLQQQNQKYKEAIDKAIEYINKMFDTGFYNDDYYLGHLKMILKDKEVE